ncbi:hypothetical protein DTO217A2_37 [Paecilomyces variotii]|nr:hypothetical protein DTO217A2_37 [Paecilomyces variotii]
MPLRQSMFARSTLKQLVPVAFRGAARQQTNGANKLQVGIDHDSVSTFCDLPCWSSNNPIVPVSHWGREAEDTYHTLCAISHSSEPGAPQSGRFSDRHERPLDMSPPNTDH